MQKAGKKTVVFPDLVSEKVWPSRFEKVNLLENLKIAGGRPCKTKQNAGKMTPFFPALVPETVRPSRFENQFFRKIERSGFLAVSKIAKRRQNSAVFSGSCFLAEAPCVAFSWVEFFDQLLRWNFRGMFYAGKPSRWNFLVGRFWI